MVDRRRLRRLKAKAQKGDILVRLADGNTEVYSKYAPFYLWAYMVEEGMAAEEGTELPEPTSPQGIEAQRLHEALENATPESRAQYEARYGGMFKWEESSYDEG